ncbi:hypothetical protein MP228_001957 [Amoeboaphelidium protococcarum]|nr:hypothetical protein MP228_001957 [Amoeboaphelidium protococcarum]
MSSSMIDKTFREYDSGAKGHLNVGEFCQLLADMDVDGARFQQCFDYMLSANRTSANVIDLSAFKKGFVNLYFWKFQVPESYRKQNAAAAAPSVDVNVKSSVSNNNFVIDGNVVRLIKMVDIVAQKSAVQSVAVPDEKAATAQSVAVDKVSQDGSPAGVKQASTEQQQVPSQTKAETSPQAQEIAPAAIQAQPAVSQTAAASVPVAACRPSLSSSSAAAVKTGVNVMPASQTVITPAGLTRSTSMRRNDGAGGGLTRSTSTRRPQQQPGQIHVGVAGAARGGQPNSAPATALPLSGSSATTAGAQVGNDPDWMKKVLEQKIIEATGIGKKDDQAAINKDPTWMAQLKKESAPSPVRKESTGKSEGQ